MPLKIKTKLFIFYSIVFTVSIALILVISKTILLKGFEKIENDYIGESIVRLNEVLSTEKESLSVLTTSWSFWDDTYNYVKKPSPKYTNDNYLNEGFFENKINSVFIFDSVGKLLFSSSCDFENKKFITDSNNYVEFISKNINKSIGPDKVQPQTGIYYFNQKIYIYAINPILPHTNVKVTKPNGFFVSIKEINKSFISSIEKKLKINLKFNYSNSFEKNSQFNIKKEKDHAHLYVYVPVNNQENTAQFEMFFKRDIYMFAEKVMLVFSALLVLFSFFLLALVNYFINKVITNKILTLTKELEMISGQKTDCEKVTTFPDDEIGKLSTQINSTLQKIQENQTLINHSAKFASLGEMAGSIAHEINNPLAVIQVHSQKILRQCKDGQIKHGDMIKNSEKILQNVERIVRVIKSLKLASRSGENDEFKLIKTGEILTELENLYNYNLRNRDIKIDLSSYDRNIEIEVNHVQILQVFINIINNAIDAISTLDERWIKIETKRDLNRVEFHITDSGDKIPDNIADKILEPFYTTKSVGKGTGLGLSIANKIVKAHKGILTLDRESKNTCFVIVLPVFEQSSSENKEQIKAS